MAALYHGTGARLRPCAAAAALRARRSAHCNSASVPRRLLICHWSRALRCAYVAHLCGSQPRIPARARGRWLAARGVATRPQEPRPLRARIGSNGYRFSPNSIETHGHLDKPAMTLLHSLANAAERYSSGFVGAESFMSSLPQEFATVNVKWNARTGTTLSVSCCTSVRTRNLQCGTMKERACICVCLIKFCVCAYIHASL